MKRILVVGTVAVLIMLATLPACNAGGEDGVPTDEGNQQSPSVLGSPGETPQSTAAPLDADAISALWQASSHAETYVLDGNGNNSACTRCHAPMNYIPTMEEIPQTCFVCKFELSEPPPLTSEDSWANIQCNVCHEVDKKEKIKPEYSWLEVAAVGQYAAVESTTALCLKCHTSGNLPAHKPEITLQNAHLDLTCTNCHDAHSVAASCSTSGCHEEILTAIPVIAGHDENHRNVTCFACHDAAGLEVNPDEGNGNWHTYIPIETFDGQSMRIPYASHNIVKESSCTRCHFVGNPWQLVENVTSEP